MSLKHALLGILSYGPMTGYELKQFFDSSVQHFWTAELSQIYPTLKSLEEQGFVTKRVQFQENRPNRKIYDVTETGHDELVRWVREAPATSMVRDAFLIKVFFGSEVPLEDLLIVLRRQREEQQRQLKGGDETRQHISQGMEQRKGTRHGVFWTLTLDLMMAYRQAYSDWCDRSIQILEEALGDDDLHAAEHKLALPHDHSAETSETA